MKIFNLTESTFNRDTTCMYTFELVEGDRVALNHIPQNACDLFYSEQADKELSFVIFDTVTLADYSFVLARESNLNEREKGVEIIAMGYNCIDSYRDLVNQLKYHVFRLEENNNYKYNYIWASHAAFTEIMVIQSENNAVLERQ